MIDSGKIKITNDGKIIMQFSNYHHVIDSDTELCYKHQVDKVIAEKDKEIAELKNYADVVNKDFELVDNQNERLLKIVRHNKYKRCLALYDYCLYELEFAFRDPCIERSVEGCVRWRKWANLWLELAEKFKEAK